MQRSTVMIFSASTTGFTIADSYIGKIASYGNSELIKGNITSDGSVTKDLSAYRFIMFVYYTGLHYRQTAIYPSAIVMGSTKCGFDNLDSSSRCYCLKQSYNNSTHEITYMTQIPSSGNWASGYFEIHGIK